jgi:hypothetical protein
MIDPESGAIMPEMQWSSVVFPPPLSPIKTICSLAFIAKLGMSSTGKRRPSGKLNALES